MQPLKKFSCLAHRILNSVQAFLSHLKRTTSPRALFSSGTASIVMLTARCILKERCVVQWNLPKPKLPVQANKIFPLFLDISPSDMVVRSKHDWC